VPKFSIEILPPIFKKRVRSIHPAVASDQMPDIATSAAGPLATLAQPGRCLMPFGLEIGVAHCDAARAKLGRA